jgi:hypothetical protein
LGKLSASASRTVASGGRRLSFARRADISRSTERHPPPKKGIGAFSTANTTGPV